MHFEPNKMQHHQIIMAHSHLNYLLVSISGLSSPQIQSKYQVFTYTSHNITLRQIAESVLKSKHISDFTDVSVKDENNLTLQSSTTISKLRILIGYENLNGFKIKIRLGNAELQGSSLSLEQCYPYNIKYQLCINIVNSNNKIYQILELHRHFQIKDLACHILKYLNQNSKYNLELADIKLKKPISHKQIEINLNNQYHVFEHINNKDIINAYINQSKMPKVSAVNWPIDFQLLLFVAEDQLSLKLPYDQLKQLKIETIFKELGIQNYEEYGLQAFNKFYYPFEQLSALKHDLDFYPAKDKVVVLRAIKQKIKFRHFISQPLANSESFNFKHLQLTPLGQEIYYKCQQKAAKLSQNSKNYNEYLIILCFLKGIQYIQNNQITNIKVQINQFLRTQKFLLQKKQNLDKIWQYRFLHDLVQAIHFICEQHGDQSYISFSYEVFDKKDQLIDFKQFLCGSLRKKENKNCYVIRDAKGYRFPEELQPQQDEQVIYLPYTQFKITQIEGNETKTIHLDQFDGGIPSCNLSIILWIDDKLTEGPIIFKNAHHKESSVLYQLRSNKQLDEWLKVHEDLLNKPNIRISVITNMRRVEEGVEHKDAGITTIQQIRKRLCDVFIFMYIGHIEGTILHLEKNNIIMDQIKIGNSYKEVEKFILHLAKCFPVKINKTTDIVELDRCCVM